MAKTKKDSVLTVKDAVTLINDLNSFRAKLSNLNSELETHNTDLASTEKIYGVDSKEYKLKKEMVDNVLEQIKETNEKIDTLKFKRSELKPVLDQLTKDFEDALRAETSKEYHIEIASTKEGSEGNGRKVFKTLMNFIEHNVKFTAKTAANLMVLHHNMIENREWVKSKDFDNTIILRSASVISLYRFIIDEMEGKGYFEAREFLECWANCGQPISEAVREIQKDNANSRQLGADLNLVEEEFNRSEDDLPHDEQKITTQEEVAPEVGE